MNSRRPQGEGPTGSPRYVWTDEPPDPTTFTLMLRRAVAEGQPGALNTTKVKTAAAAVDSVWQRGMTHLLRGLPAARPHPMTSRNQHRRTGSQG